MLGRRIAIVALLMIGLSSAVMMSASAATSCSALAYTPVPTVGIDNSGNVESEGKVTCYFTHSYDMGAAAVTVTLQRDGFVGWVNLEKTGWLNTGTGHTTADGVQNWTCEPGKLFTYQTIAEGGGNDDDDKSNDLSNSDTSSSIRWQCPPPEDLLPIH